MVAVLGMVAAARLRLLDFPLERDEGEYAYTGQLILQGIPPYELACNMKFPGIYAAYALIMAVFGQTPAGIHFGVLCMTTLTALMLYWLGKNILDRTAGITAATAYAVLAAGQLMLGLAGHATHFAAFFATAGLCALWKTRQNPSWLADCAAGLLFGTALLMKQHAVFIGLWAAMAVSMARLRQPEIPIVRRLRAVMTFGAGMILPFGLCCLVLWHAGVFGRFWFWTIDYAREYAFLKPVSWGRDELLKVVQRLISTEFPLWPMVAAGFVLLWLDKRLQPARFWLCGFFAASALTVFPGLYFRVHYFLLTLPAVALLIGCATSGMRRLGEQKLQGSLFLNWPVFAFSLLLAAATYVNYPIWFAVPLPQAVRMVYGSDTLLEAPPAGGLHSHPFAALRACGGARVGAGNLFSFPPPFGDGIYLCLSADGAAAVCPADAARDDPRNRDRSPGICGLCR